MHFKDKTVLVTGANRGIGKALVEALLKKDVKRVYAGARTVSTLPDFGDSRVTGLQLDITNRSQINKAAEFASDVDIVINNAGVAAFAGLLDGPVDVIQRDMNTNFYGTLNVVRAFVPYLETKKESAIVNVVTIGAFVNFPAIGGYCASKAALFSMSQGIRIELAPKGIAVHTVNPGPIDTDMIKGLDTKKTNPAQAAENILAGVESNEADIFPDAGGKGMFEMWNHNYKDLESAISRMHHS